MNSNVVLAPGHTKLYIPPEPQEIGSTLQQLLKALVFLHTNLVAHRDLKPDNVLLGSETGPKTWKLDFNLACDFDPEGRMSEMVGSKPFAAPEVYEEDYTEKCDLYSMGILFIALVTGKLYDEHQKAPAEQKRLFNASRWLDRAGPGALELAKQMIAPEAERCSAQEALEMSLFSERASPGACCVIH